MRNRLLDQLTHPIRIQKKSYVADGTGGQKECDSQAIHLWARIRPLPPHKQKDFFPKGLKSSSFPKQLWGELWEVVVRNQGDLSHMQDISWGTHILKPITPAQLHTIPGYTRFYAATWTNQE